jgi:hypothetical protein
MVTACWRRRCRRGTAACPPMHVWRRAGRTGGPPVRGACTVWRRGDTHEARRGAGA